MIIKESYRGNLPHFQLPGQWYFVTCVLNGTFPFSVLKEHSEKIRLLQLKIAQSVEQNHGNIELLSLKKKYILYRMRHFFMMEKLLNNSDFQGISLVKEQNRKVIEESLKFWEKKRLTNHAWCIMPNHLHWVFTLNQKDEMGRPVYLQNVLHSVKLFSSRRINENENRKGQLWMHESYDITIRNEMHFRNVIEYTINNPVKAEFIENWMEWPGTFVDLELV